MKTAKSLYFLAVLPPDPIYEEAQGYKQLFATEYDSKAALRSPPHITLHMPFKLAEQKELKLVDVLKNIAEDYTPFSCELNGFSHFGERTIFIDVEDNDSMHQLFKTLMKAMKVNLNIFNADYKNRGYNPHLTLAFRDLKKEQFRKAWDQFKGIDYRRKFEVNEFSLLKHNGKTWDIHKHFRLNS